MTTYIATLPAAKAVVLNARDLDGKPLSTRDPASLDSLDKDEARLFLDMLGLRDGRAIVPDDVRNYDVPGAGPDKSSPSTASDMPTVRDLHPERCTTPAGLRWEVAS